LHESLVATSWKHQRKIASTSKRLSTMSCAPCDARNNSYTALQIEEVRTLRTEKAHEFHGTIDNMDETGGQGKRKGTRGHAPSYEAMREYVSSRRDKPARRRAERRPSCRAFTDSFVDPFVGLVAELSSRNPSRSLSRDSEHETTQVISDGVQSLPVFILSTLIPFVDLTNFFTRTSLTRKREG